MLLWALAFKYSSGKVTEYAVETSKRQLEGWRLIGSEKLGIKILFFKARYYSNIPWFGRTNHGS